MNHKTAHQRFGFTLVEMMLALVAGLIVSAAALSFFLSSMKSNGEYVQSTRLTQELRNTLDLMSRDLRRAGYDDDGLKYLGNTNVSPFTPMCLSTSGAPTVCVAPDSVGDCIKYAYDRSYPNGGTTLVGAEGQLNVGTGEVRAIRRRAYTVGDLSGVGVIEYAESFFDGAANVSPACGAAGPAYSATNRYPGCNTTTGWCPLSDPTRLDITALTITNLSRQIGVNPTAQIQRQFSIDIVGRLAGSTEYTRNVQTSIKIRSDCMRATISNCNASP